MKRPFANTQLLLCAAGDVRKAPNRDDTPGSTELDLRCKRERRLEDFYNEQKRIGEAAKRAGDEIKNAIIEATQAVAAGVSAVIEVKNGNAIGLALAANEAMSASGHAIEALKSTATAGGEIMQEYGNAILNAPPGTPMLGG